MAKIGLQFDSDLVELTKGKLLHQLHDDVHPERNFTIANLVPGTFREMAIDRFGTKISLDQDGSWHIPGAANLNFKLTAGATAELRVLKSGELFRYKLNDGDPGNDADEVVKADGTTAYVSLIFHFSFDIAGTAKFSFPDGFGVSADRSTGKTFDFEMHHAFPLDTVIRQAVIATFEDLVLPFQPDVVETLGVGDYVRWGFAGNLKLGIGAQWGVSDVLIAGKSPAEVAASIGHVQLAKLGVTSTPTIAAGLNFAVTYQHSDQFTMLVHRTPTDLSLMLFTMEKTDTGVSLTASVKFDPQTEIDLKESALAEIAGKVSTLESKLQIKKLIADTNERIETLKQSIALKVSNDRILSNAALFHYHFDLSIPGAVDHGYGLAMQGRWDQAIGVPGVTLEPGTLLERDFEKATALSFHFFDLFRFSDTTQYFEKTKLLYLGDQTLRFQLEDDIGIAQDDGVAGHTGHVELYFSAVMLKANLQDVSNTEVRLHCKLVDSANRDKALQTAAVLEHAGNATSPAGVELQQLAKSNPALNVQIEAIVYPAAFARLSVSEYEGSRPSAVPHAADNRNWDVFVDAVNVVLEGTGLRFPAAVSNFATFESLQIAAVDRVGGLGPADRRHLGNPEAIPPSAYNNDLNILNWMETAREFLNFCDDLKHLREVSLTQTGQQYGDLIKRLKVIARQDMPGVWFTKPTLLALLRLMNGSVTLTKAPDPVIPPGGKFAAAFEVR